MSTCYTYLVFFQTELLKLLSEERESSKTAIEKALEEENVRMKVSIC